MVGGDVGGVDVSVQVLVPAGDALGVCLKAEGVQAALAYGSERRGALSRRAELGLVRQQVVAEVVVRSEELSYTAAQCRYGVLNEWGLFLFRQSYCLWNAFCRPFHSLFSEIIPADKHASLCRRILSFHYLCAVLQK